MFDAYELDGVPLQGLAGLYARMYQGRCNHRLGRTKDALGYYGELLDQPSEPQAFRELKTRTLRLAMESWLDPQERKYMEAIKQATAWIDAAPRSSQRSPDMLAIRLSLALALQMRAEEFEKRKSPDVATIRSSYSDALDNAEFVAAEEGDLQDKAAELVLSLGGRTKVDPAAPPENFAAAQKKGKESLDQMGPAAQEIVKLERLLGRSSPADQPRVKQQLNAARERLNEFQDNALASYRLAMQLADIVLQQALPCVFVSVTYRLIDPRHGLEQRLGAFLLVAQAIAFAGASLGYLIACLSPDSEFATVVAPLFVFPMILLGGLYANVGAIPAGARWINKVNPINYGFQAVSQAQWFSTVSEPSTRSRSSHRWRGGGSIAQPYAIDASPQRRRDYGDIDGFPPVFATGKDVLAFFSLSQRSFESNLYRLLAVGLCLRTAVFVAVALTAGRRGLLEVVTEAQATENPLVS